MYRDTSSVDCALGQALETSNLKDDQSSVAYPSITANLTKFSAQELLADTILDE